MLPAVKVTLAPVVMAVALPLCAGEIHDAVRERDLARIRSLLERDAGLVNARGEGGVTPLHMAAGLNARDTAELLIALLRGILKKSC